MRIKAKRLRKSLKVNKFFQTTARMLFHDDKWKNDIRPRVIKRLQKKKKGEANSSNPKWLATMKKIEGKLWGRLSETEQEEYEKRAREINEGQLAKEAQAEYVVSG